MVACCNSSGTRQGEEKGRETEKGNNDKKGEGEGCGTRRLKLLRRGLRSQQIWAMGCISIVLRAEAQRKFGPQGSQGKQMSKKRTTRCSSSRPTTSAAEWRPPEDPSSSPGASPASLPPPLPASSPSASSPSASSPPPLPASASSPPPFRHPRPRRRLHCQPHQPRRRLHCQPHQPRRRLHCQPNLTSISAASTASLKGEVAGGTTVEHLLHRCRRMRRVHPTDDVGMTRS